MADFSKQHDDFHHNGFQFVNVELDVGLTFARIALASKGPRRIDRNRTNARKAYDSALHVLSTLVLEKDQAATLDSKLDALKSNLEVLGEKL